MYNKERDVRRVRVWVFLNIRFEMLLLYSLLCPRSVISRRENFHTLPWTLLIASLVMSDDSALRPAFSRCSDGLCP
jgi:hypothetical protein